MSESDRRDAYFERNIRPCRAELRYAAFDAKFDQKCGALSRPHTLSRPCRIAFILSFIPGMRAKRIAPWKET